MIKINVLTFPVLILFYGSALTQTGDENDWQPREELKDYAITSTTDNNAPTLTNPTHLFTRADAEKILGEPAHLDDTATIVNKDAVQYKSSYIANAKDPKTGKTGGVYYLFERYNSATTAHEVYASFQVGNQSQEGFSILHGMGDEAYYHSDGENFHLIIVRKGKNMFRLKVNKITSNTSLDELNKVAKYITVEL